MSDPFRRLRSAALGALAALSLVSGAQAENLCRDPGLQASFTTGGYFSPPEPMKPEFVHFTRADGTRGALEDYRGKTVMLLFWASWCGGCMMELPAIDALIKDYEGTDLVILPLSIDEIQDPRSNDLFRHYRLEHPEAPKQDEALSPVQESEFLRKTTRWFLDLQGWGNLAANVDYGRRLFETLCQAGTPAHVMIDPQGQVSEIFVGVQAFGGPSGRKYLDLLAGKSQDEELKRILSPRRL